MDAAGPAANAARFGDPAIPACSVRLHADKSHVGASDTAPCGGTGTKWPLTDRRPRAAMARQRIGTPRRTSRRTSNRLTLTARPPAGVARCPSTSTATTCGVTRRRCRGSSAAASCSAGMAGRSAPLHRDRRQPKPFRTHLRRAIPDADAAEHRRPAHGGPAARRQAARPLRQSPGLAGRRGGGRLPAERVLVGTVRVLLRLRDENLARMASLAGALKRGEGALPLSSEATGASVSQHLARKNTSRLPVLIVAAAYEAAGTKLAENLLPLTSTTPRTARPALWAMWRFASLAATPWSRPARRS